MKDIRGSFCGLEQLGDEEKGIKVSTYAWDICSNIFDGYVDIHFHGLPGENPEAYLKRFFDLHSFTLKGISEDEQLRFLFKSSLKGKAKEWEETTPSDYLDTWYNVESRFMGRFFYPETGDELRDFRQHENEGIYEAWKRWEKYTNLPHNKDTPLGNKVKLFYFGLRKPTKTLVDNAMGKGLNSKTCEKAYKIIRELAEKERSKESVHDTLGKTGRTARLQEEWRKKESLELILHQKVLQCASISVTKREHLEEEEIAVPTEDMEGLKEAKGDSPEGMHPRQQPRKPLQEVMEDFMEFLINFKKELTEELKSHKKVAPKKAAPCLTAKEGQDDASQNWITHEEDAWKDDKEDELNGARKEKCNITSSRPGLSVVEHLSSHNFGKLNSLKALGIEEEVKVPQKKESEPKAIAKIPQPTKIRSSSVQTEELLTKEEVSLELAMVIARRRFDFDKEERPKEDPPDWRSRKVKAKDVAKNACERRKRGRAKKKVPLSVDDIRRELGILLNFKRSNGCVQAWGKTELNGKKEKERVFRSARQDLWKMVETWKKLSLDKGDGASKFEGPEINNKGSQEPP